MRQRGDEPHRRLQLRRTAPTFGARRSAYGALRFEQPPLLEHPNCDSAPPFQREHGSVAPTDLFPNTHRAPIRNALTEADVFQTG